MINQMTDSHILVNEFTLCEPDTLDEAIALLAEHGPSARAMSGGTDLLVHMKIERAAPEYVVSLNRIPGLDLIESGDGYLRLGARATIAAVERHSLVRRYYPALAEACDAFSTRQVQVMGTLGGNLCNGSPASDTAPALLAYGAVVRLQGPTGERWLPLEQFFLRPGKTALRRGELLTEVLLPQPGAPREQAAESTGAGAPSATCVGSAFLKTARVAADIAKASAAVALVVRDDQIQEARLAFGAVAPVPMRARRAEALLSGQRYSQELIEAVAQAAAQEITPIDDVRSEAWYRREVVRVMARDGLERAWRRAGGGGGGTEEWRRRAVEEWKYGYDNSSAGGGDSSPASGQSRVVAGQIPHPHTPTPPLPPGAQRRVTLRVNGQACRVWVSPNDLLLNVLREKLALTGTKYGCGIGECSACTVQMDGQPVLACLVLAATAEGREIRTVEGLEGARGELDPLQEAFVEHAAFQCGYCTPGMLMTAESLLAEYPHPTEGDVRHYLRGNLCRCTGYASIVRAVLACAAEEAV